MSNGTKLTPSITCRGPTFHARGFQDGRVEVRADDGRVRNASGLHLARPADERRHTQPPLVGVALLTAKRKVGSLRIDTAIVGREDHQGLLGKPQVIQFLEQAANTIIQAGHHGGEDRVVLRVFGSTFVLNLAISDSGACKRSPIAVCGAK